MISDIHCCDKSPNTQCKTACKEILRTEKTTQEIMDRLILSCGPPDPKVS